MKHYQAGFFFGAASATAPTPASVATTAAAAGLGSGGTDVTIDGAARVIVELDIKFIGPAADTMSIPPTPEVIVIDKCDFGFEFHSPLSSPSFALKLIYHFRFIFYWRCFLPSL